MLLKSESDRVTFCHLYFFFLVIGGVLVLFFYLDDMEGSLFRHTDYVDDIHLLIH